MDNYGILVRPGTPSGTYRVEIGLYSVDNGERLPVTKGPDVGTDRVLLPPIAIEPAPKTLPLDAFDIQHAGIERLGSLDLLGYDLYRLGFEANIQQTMHPGDAVHLNLYWQTSQRVSDMEMTIRVTGSGGNAVASVSHALGGAASPSSTWQVDEIIRDQLDVPLGSDVVPGSYTIEGELIVDGTAHTIPLGAFEVQE